VSLPLPRRVFAPVMHAHVRARAQLPPPARISPRNEYRRHSSSCHATTCRRQDEAERGRLRASSHADDASLRRGERLEGRRSACACRRRVMAMMPVLFCLYAGATVLPSSHARSSKFIALWRHAAPYAVEGEQCVVARLQN